MGILDRFRKRPGQATVPPSGSGAYPRAVKEYLLLASGLGIVAAPDEVRAKYGEVLERDANAYLIRPAESLTHPPALIAAALHVALADPGLAQIREHVQFGLFHLDSYLTAAEREPYADAIDSASLALATIAQPEMVRLMERDRDAALKLIAGLPEAQPEALEPLHRILRRRHTARWVEMLTRFPDWWTPEEKSAMYSRWMFEQAVDVAAVSRAAYDELEASSGPEWSIAFARFKSLWGELELLLDDARSYEAASGRTDGAYSKLVSYAYALLHQFMGAITNRDQALLDETYDRFREAQDTLGKLAAKHAELTKLLTDDVLRKGKIEFPAVDVIPDAPPARRAQADRAWEPKGFIEHDDDDEGD